VLIGTPQELYKCIDDSVDLYVDADFAQYSWSTGAEGDRITVSQPGDYIVYVTDDEDCELTDSVVVLDYTPLENNLLTNKGTYLEAIASTSYAWYRDGTMVEGESDQVLTLTAPGNYYVTLLDGNGCVSASDTLQVIMTAIAGETGSTTCLIYPNPGKGKFVFEFKTVPQEDIEIVFTNAIGQQVRKVKIDSQSNRFLYQVNLEDQPSGVYWAYLRQGDKTTVVRLVNIN
jgi:hypothetical protein